MQNTEAQELLSEILKHAQEGRLTEFHLIMTWNEFIFYRQQRRATKLVIKLLKNVAKTLFKNYCKGITTGSADINKLLASRQLQDCVAFYERELATINTILDEYDDYLGQGNFWHAFLGGERTFTWNIP